MGLFKKNNDNETELITVLGEIRDNLKTGVSEDRFNKVVTELENIVVEFKKDKTVEIEELNKVISRHEGSIGNLEKIVEKQDELMDKQNHKIKILTSTSEKMLEILKLMNKPKVDVSVDISDTDAMDKPKKENKPVKTKKTENRHRQYSYANSIRLANLEGLNKDGKFYRKTGCRGKPYFKWDITHLLKLKDIIPKTNEYPTIKSISNKVGLSTITCSDLICLIEDGYFDKFFNEWEQIQADKMYKNDWKPILENNPEKRKEKGYC